MLLCCEFVKSLDPLSVFFLLINKVAFYSILHNFNATVFYFYSHRINNMQKNIFSLKLRNFTLFGLFSEIIVSC